MPKIILCVTNDLSFDQRMHRVCASLARAGHEVELVGRLRAASPSLPQRPFRQTRLRCRFEKGKFFYLEYNLRLFFFLLCSRFDMLCAVDLDTIAPVWIAGRLRGAALAFDAHEFFTHTPEVARRPAIQWVWERVARFFIPRMDVCYTVGPALAEIMGAEYKKPFSVVRNLPLRSDELQGASPPSGKPVFLYQGALNEGRGIEALLEVMPRFPEAELWLAGEGDLTGELKEMTQRLQLDARVRFLGFVSPEYLPGLTRQATIGFNLLENKGLSYYYSLANKAFDYIQAGLPSVQMDFPEYRALQERYGTFVLANDLAPETLEAVIRRLLDDQAYYQSVQERCRQAAKELIWEKEEPLLLKVYKGL
jgi:glycosyltransferase involved in cell wall biosynthesis